MGRSRSQAVMPQPIVCDNGTGFLKIGFAGDNFPTKTFPTMVGRPVLRSEERMVDYQLKDIMVGQECDAARANLEITYPITEGKINDWDDMCKLWDHAFYDQLQVDPTVSKLMLTEAPMNPRENREKMVQTMFETYNFGHVHVDVQAVLVLYSQGLMTGVVVDSGDGVTHVVPVYDSYVLPDCVERLDLAGRHLTQRLVELMVFSGYSFNRSSDFETLRTIKDKYCYVAYDPDKEEKLCTNTTSQIEKCTLPDGTEIKLNEERWLCPEALFDPSKMGKEAPGIAEVTFNSINKAPIDTREAFYGNIVLSGGTTMFPGLPTRMLKEVTQLYTTKICKGGPMKMKINIEDPPRRKHMVFQGGAVLAGITADQDDWWISKQEFEEEGFNVLHKKCPLMSS